VWKFETREKESKKFDVKGGKRKVKVAVSKGARRGRDEKEKHYPRSRKRE